MAGLFIGIGLWVAPSALLLVVVIGVETLSGLRRWTRVLTRRPD